MPRTLGDTFLHVDRIDRFVSVERPLVEYVHQPADAVAERIARYVAEIIEDGATLHVDLGRIPNETLKHLHTRRNLGIHSNVITDPILDLIEQGVITGRHKTLHPGKIVTSFCIGSRRLYEFLHDNALFEFRPIEYVADPQVVAQNYKMASLTQALVIDLTGEVCADTNSTGSTTAASPLSSTFTAAPPGHSRASRLCASNRRRTTARSSASGRLCS